MKKQTRKQKMSSKVQSIVVIAFFIAVIVFIAYPVITSNNVPLLATPADQMHLKIDQSDKNDDKIISPIFTENQN